MSDVVWDTGRWMPLEQAHVARADSLTRDRRDRAARGAHHPVEDFLFEYYRFAPAQLRRWHPGAGVLLADADGLPRAAWRYSRTNESGAVGLDAGRFWAERGEFVDFVRSLLEATLARPGALGCFGLHEWAMAYRLPAEEVRHARWPLRLGSAGTDAVVEAHQIRCTHYDAYRFFTPAATARNTVQPTRESQREHEQPACLHAGMDLYKWAFKLAPAIPGDLLLDAFELARDLRTLDMQASPYDLSGLGYAPVPIETAAGKAHYLEQQRAFLVRGNALRRRLLEALDVLEAGAQGSARGDSGADEPVCQAVDQGGPGRLDDVAGNADRRP